MDFNIVSSALGCNYREEGERERDIYSTRIKG